MATDETVRVLGVDACRAGWVAVELHDGAFAGAYASPALEALVAGRSDLAAIGVDMPLGLLAEGWRQADTEAAAVLGIRRPTVFRVPPRPVWDEADYDLALARCREINGTGFSVQAWSLQRWLLEANQCWESARHPLYEVHPEVSFRELAGRDAPLAGKKTWAGQTERRLALRDAGIVLPDVLGPAGKAAPDDVLDAAAAAWSVARVAGGRARSLPNPPQLDDHHRPIAIWY